jgi:hypothetical protein
MTKPKYRITTIVASKPKRFWNETAPNKQTAYRQAEKKLENGEAIWFVVAWNREAILNGE